MKTSDGRVVDALNPPKGSGPMDITGRIISNMHDPDNKPIMARNCRRVLVPYTEQELRDSKNGLKAHVQVMRK